MKILITGASGFIGTHLLKATCMNFGANNVVAFSSKKIELCHNIVYESIDFKLSEADCTLLASVEVLIHAGAFIPKSTVEANMPAGCNGNIYFTEKLLNLPFKNLKKIIYLSTVDVYETVELTTESTPTIPATLYGFSKLYCEKMTTIFSTNNNLTCQILRIGHVYGPGEEKFSKFLPNTIKKIIAGDQVELWGEGDEMRSFIYIHDVTTAIVNAVHLQEKVGVINIVGGVAISMSKLADKLIDISRKRVKVIKKDFNGAKRNYIFDNKKLRQYLLAQETDLNVGLNIEYSHVENLS